MSFPVMPPTKWNGELLAYLPTEGAGLHETKVMGIEGFRPQTRQAPGLGHREHAFVEYLSHWLEPKKLALFCQVTTTE